MDGRLHISSGTTDVGEIEAEWKQALSGKTIMGLSGRTVTIGRGSSNMVHIGSKTTAVSRRHATIVESSSGGFELLISGLNGVRVNGELHGTGARVALHSNDELNFVGIRFRFRAAERAVDAGDDWWPAPVRKRVADAPGSHTSLSKRVRGLSSEVGGLYQNSTDTLVGTDDVAHPHFIDDLPPSSPPPMPLLDFDESVCGDEPALDDELPALPAPKIAVVDKENAAPPKQNTAPAKTPKRAKAAKRDDDMMASLRELLGIVDPSEALADSIDSDTEAFLTAAPAQPLALAHGGSLADLLVESMVFSARTSHTISDLLRDVAPSDADARAWRHHVTWTLFHTRCFGRVERRVKDASDRRAEDRWYYDAAADACPLRRANFGGLARTARRCTLRDTQYFFKQVPKLPSFRYK
ncbi:hypothetical protein GGI09_005692 [Coemansia sp. S100]|nr:hypothetical protein LPJ71_007791 [Coemansia sp. S17]KAJ2086055.1 hypothetical protein GGI16_006674 [Coemansia sp. S142-1]KAJ2093907.1 hypothetical protein GGI09_005692 [Coemansia sp. S100]